MTKFVSAAAGVAFTVLPSFASADWTGRYFGATFGATSNGEIEVTDTDATDAVDFGALAPLDDSNVFGVHYGSMSQNNQRVLGSEAAILFAPDAAFSDDVLVDGAIFDFKGKAGVGVDRFLAYGVLGLSLIGGSFGVNDLNTVGLAYGVGLGFLPTDTVAISAEYIARSTSEEFIEADATINIETLTLRASFKF